jgi:hypothetical protein
MKNENRIARLFLQTSEQLQAILEMVVVAAGVAGEFSLTIWLLAKGANRKTNN